jgi:hypothetical protein
MRGGPRSGGGGEMVFELAKVWVEPVCDGGFEEAAEAFDRVEFGAVGRQREETKIFRQTRVVDRQMEAGLVLNDRKRPVGIHLNLKATVERDS